jgi:hypothetical protein
MKTKKLILFLAAALTALSLNSCLQHEVTLTLNKDGSGTIVEEKRLSDQAVAMINKINGEDQAEVQAEARDPLSYEKRVKELGEGVTFVKSEPVTVGTQKGTRVTYRFADINKVRIGGAESLEAMSYEMEAEDEKVDDKDKISFSYKNGLLTVKPNFPFNKEGAKGEKAKEEVTEEEQIGLIKTMADMKVSFKLVFDSGIAETNATHQEKNTVTILELDMNKIMEKPENLKKFMGLQNADQAEVMNNIIGIKAETKPEITIKLK